MKTKTKEHLLEIVTFEHGSQNNGLRKSYVVPGKLKAKRGETISWKSDKSAAIMFFPDETLFGVREKEIKSGEKITLTVSEEVTPGRYSYAVYTEGTRDFAEGGSAPVMIIK